MVRVIWCSASCRVYLHAPALCALIILALLGCAAGGPAAVPPAPLHLEEARALMEDRSFARAVSLLEADAAGSPEDSEIRYMLGEAHFRMKRYALASRMFREALRLSPGHYNALHRLWASRLEEARASGRLREEEASVRMEIEAAAGGEGRGPGSIFASYMGLRYLNDIDGRLPLIRRLAVEAREEELRLLVDAFLLDDILEKKDDGAASMDLSLTYLVNFKDGRGTPAAAGVYFRLLAAGTDPDALPGAVAGALGSMGESPEALLAASGALIEKGSGLEMADGLIRRGIALLEGPAAREPRWHYNRVDWLRLVTMRLASAYGMLGRVYLARGDEASAGSALERSVKLWPKEGRYRYLLGRLRASQGRHEEAAAELRAALDLGAEEDARELLSGALSRAFGHEGPPEEYYASREGIARFVDSTERAGLSGVRAERLSFGDFDNDGDQDLLLSGPRLFVNSGEGGYKEVTEDSGLGGLEGYGGGVFGDYDNDGNLDLYLFSAGVNRLFRNSGQGKFEDVTLYAFGGLQDAPTGAAAWGDMNGDGLLDLYVANYETAAVERGVCAPDVLWMNMGDGAFRDMTAVSGMVPDEDMCGRGVFWWDPDGDGRSDVMVSNYRLDPNFLWMNRGPAGFEDMAGKAGVRGSNVEGAFGHTIGSAFGDVDGDVDMDLVSANLAHPRYLDVSETTRLYLNTGGPGPSFEDRTGPSGIDYYETHAEPTLADVDNDGDLDLFITSIYPGMRSFLYLNDGGGSFRDATWVSGAMVRNSWGAAFSDIDGDGDLDLAVASSEGVRLLENQGSPGGWLSVRIESRTCQSKGVGSRVSVETGGRRQVREISAGKGAGTGEPAVAHFGLGRGAVGAALEVVSSCGEARRFTLGVLDREVVVRY